MSDFVLFQLMPLFYDILGKNCRIIGRPIFDKLPTPHVLFCPILLDPPSPPKIGHHLCMFPKYIQLSKLW